MSKGLETLKEIKRKPFSWEKLKDSLDTIEKELKALEIILKGFNMWVEVIKDYKGNLIYRLVLCYNLSDRFYLNIKKEQYDLLKEVCL